MSNKTCRGRFVGWWLGAVWLSCALSTQAAPILAPDHVKFGTLKNGLRVVAKEEPGQDAVALSLYIKAGTLCEPPGKSGLAYLCQRLVFGEEGRDPTEGFGRQIQDLGGEAMVGTTRDFVQVTVTVARDYVNDVLQVMGRSLARPDLGKEACEREQQAVLERLRQSQEQVTPLGLEARLGRMLWSEAFRKHPYGGAPHGSEAEVQKLQPSDAEGFVRRCYAPDSISLISVGGLTLAELLPLAEEAFGKLEPARKRGPQPAAEPAQTSRRVRIDREPRLKATMLSLAFRAAGIEDKTDVCALDLIYTLLGQGDAGWLNRVLRQEKGLALNAEVDFLTQREPGLFIITLIVPPDKEMAARTALEQKLAELQQKPVTAQELDEAKRLLTVSYAFQNETCTDQTGSLGFYDAIDTYEFAIEYIKRVQAVTPEELRRVAQRYFVPERATLVILRPASGHGEREAT